MLLTTDFGLSQYFYPGEVFHTAVGTPDYVAPEVLLGHGCKSCITATLLF